MIKNDVENEGNWDVCMICYVHSLVKIEISYATNTTSKTIDMKAPSRIVKNNIKFMNLGRYLIGLVPN